MSKESVQWLVLALVIVGLVGLGVMILNQGTNTVEPSSGNNLNGNKQQTYRNRKYHFSFDYPANLQPAEVLVAEGEGGSYQEINPKNWRNSNHVDVLDPHSRNESLFTQKSLFTIEALNSAIKFQESGDATIPGANGSLKNFATSIWQYNKTNSNTSVQKNLTELLAVTVAGQPAYTFSIGGSFGTPMGGTALDEPHAYLFTEYKGLKYIIYFPTSSTVASQVFKTVKFLP